MFSSDSSVKFDVSRENPSIPFRTQKQYLTGLTKTILEHTHTES